MSHNIPIIVPVILMKRAIDFDFNNRFRQTFQTMVRYLYDNELGFVVAVVFVSAITTRNAVEK